MGFLWGVGGGGSLPRFYSWTPRMKRTDKRTFAVAVVSSSGTRRTLHASYLHRATCAAPELWGENGGGGRLYWEDIASSLTRSSPRREDAGTTWAAGCRADRFVAPARVCSMMGVLEGQQKISCLPALPGRNHGRPEDPPTHAASGGPASHTRGGPRGVDRLEGWGGGRKQTRVR